jgi:hypothetical protein
VQQWWTFELAADQGRFHPDEPNEETRAPEYLDWTTTSRDAVQPWKMHYWNIQRSNTVIEKAANVQFADPTRQKTLIAEGQFMRAYDYFWLARAYGGVPLYTSLASQTASDQPRATEAEVIDQVIRDAADAAADLPARRGGAELGRATSGAASTLLADAYRWKANVISNGAAADWQASATAAKKVIDSGVYSLDNNYLDAFNPGSQNRPEEIFAGQSHAGGGWFSTAAYGAVFFPRNNPQIDGWAVVSANPPFYRSYVPGDYRWEVTFWTKGCANGADASACPNSGKDTVIKWSPTTDPNFPDGYPHVHKYRPSDAGRNFYSNDVNTQLYRYADVLLLYAEAQARLGNPGVALTYVNMVRARARKGTGTESRTQPADLTGLSGTPLVDAIYQERSWELSYELGKRWFDLVQRGEAYFVAQLNTNDPLANFKHDVNAQHMRLPIPLEEIQKNPKLTQNPGY